MGVIFVAGVHGVGKTTVCARVAKSLKISFCSASEIIRSEKAEAIAMDRKTVVDVQGNQSLLIQGVNRICGRDGGKIILDGHFTLLKAAGGFEAVAVEVFRGLLLEGIVVYHDEPKAIAKRLESRDKAASDLMLVEQHQSLELEQACLVATALNVPIRNLKAFDEGGLIELISSITAGGE